MPDKFSLILRPPAEVNGHALRHLKLETKKNKELTTFEALGVPCLAHEVPALIEVDPVPAGITLGCSTQLCWHLYFLVDNLLDFTLFRYVSVSEKIKTH